MDRTLLAMKINPSQARALSRMTWDEMMKGNIGAWVTFFHMIEDGCAHQMIAENSAAYHILRRQ
jgi:hypothetical protein